MKIEPPPVDPAVSYACLHVMKSIGQTTALKATAILGALGVGLGAFGAHGLQDLLVSHGRLDTWETAVFYHLVHTVVLLILCLVNGWRPLAWTLFTGGVLIFSGSLYVLCLTQLNWLGAITPIGGLALIGGWLALSAGARKGSA